MKRGSVLPNCRSCPRHSAGSEIAHSPWAELIHESSESVSWTHCSSLRHRDWLNQVTWWMQLTLDSFIHSGHFYSASVSPLLLRGAPDYSTDTVLEFNAEAHRQL